MGVMMVSSDYHFTSPLFQIEPGETDETNPDCYGKQLGQWLCAKAKALGYSEAELIPEDWGWCIVCEYKDFLLGIGCGSVFKEGAEDVSPPRVEDIVWKVFPMAEVSPFALKGFIKRCLRRLDLATPLNKLDAQLQQILAQEPEIHFCEEP
jgi:hypothetical protein